MSTLPRATLMSSRPGKRRVLILSPVVPALDASMGGPRVIAQLLQALGQREQVALLYLRSDSEPPLEDRLRCACAAAVEVPRTRRWKKRSPLSMLTAPPEWVEECDEPQFPPALERLTTGWRPDVVQAEFHVMGQYVRCLGEKRPVTVLNQHEPGSAAAADRRRAGMIPGLFAPFLEIRAWRRYERRLIGQVDAIVTFTERDRSSMLELGANRVAVIRPGAEIPAQAADPGGALPPRLLFFGNYLHAPNVDAAQRLARDIFPQLAAEMPELQLELLGDSAPEELKALAGENIHVPGRVPDLKPYLDEASVVVVPLRIGGGVRVKVLEALAAGKAVVASRLALEGLDVEDGEQMRAAESDGEFVQQVLWLIRNPDERAALGTRARAWATTHLSWDRAAEQYSELYDDLLDEAGNAPRAQGRHE